MPLVDLTGLSSIRAVIDLARENLSPADLPSLVMNDPGTRGYIDAFERALSGGVPALLSKTDDGRLLDSFDIGENLLLSHASADRSVEHRWFSFLCAGVELLAWDGYEGLRATSPATSLCHVVADGRALEAVSRARSRDRAAALCAELAGALDPHLAMYARLAELLTARLEPDAVDAICRELLERHEVFHAWADERGEPNPWFLERTELVWAADIAPRALVRRWLELVEDHFPTTSPLACRIRDRLLDEGRAVVDERTRRRR